MAKLVRRTKNLVIRPLVLSDYVAWKVAKTSSSPAKNKWDLANRSSADVTLAQFKKVLRLNLKLRKDDQYYDLHVFEKKSGALIGVLALMQVVRGVSHSAFLGYSIYNTFWGCGFGKESVRAMLDIGFRDVGLHRIEAGIEPSNRRSILLARSLGLRKEGTKKRAIFMREEWVDLVIYSVTCEEFGIKWRGKTELLSRR